MLKVLKLSKVLRWLEWLRGGCDFGSAYRGSNSGGQTIFSTICGQNSRVPFIPGCRDPRVT